MAYRRRQQQSEKPFAELDSHGASSSSSSSSSLAAKAIRASSAHTQSSLSSAYIYTAPSYKDVDAPPIHSAKPPDEPKQGFWGALARKAKSILDDSEDPPSPHQPVEDQLPTPSPPPKSWPKEESPPAFQKGIGAIANSLNYIGNAVEVIFSLHFEVSFDSYTKFMVLSGYCPYWKHRCDLITFQPGQWMDESLAFDFLFMPHYCPHSSSSSSSSASLAAKYIPSAPSLPAELFSEVN